MRATDVVLDIGCGNGESTREAARRAAADRALGVDLSAPMIERARRHARDQSLANARFVQADAQVYRFGTAAFDLAISRFGAMFFDDPVTAFANIRQSLRPGGRLAMLAWQPLADNEWVLVIRAALAFGRTLPEPPPDTPGGFALARPERTRHILTEAGYDEIELTDVREPVQLGDDTYDAFTFVRGFSLVTALIGDLDTDQQATALDQLHATLAAHQTSDGVLLGGAAWLIIARRPKPRSPTVLARQRTFG